MSWRLLEFSSPNVYWDLAYDESIAKTDLGETSAHNTLRFWQTHRAVVIGRFQCVHKEVNLDYCEEKRILIARRFTGGGAVYQDKGNLNFTLRLHQTHEYVPRKLKELYEVYIGILVKALQSLSIPAEYDPFGSNVRIGKRKITGTAGWIKQGISFIHGTLLYDADLDALRESLNPLSTQPVYLRDQTRIRCMKSRRDVVTNITDEVKASPTLDAIKAAFVEHLEEFVAEPIKRGELGPEEKTTAQALYDSHYQHRSWNLGTLA